jgi:uncharacterized lipoprotein YmbA
VDAQNGLERVRRNALEAPLLLIEDEEELPDERSADGFVFASDSESQADFELYEDNSGEFRWRRGHPNGNILAGCGEGVPSRYYVLNSMAPSGAAMPAEGRTLSVNPVSLPEYLNRSDVVRRETDNRLDLAASDRWGEPLDINLTRVITEDLAHLLKDDGFVVVPSGLSAAEMTLEIQILRFERDAEGNAVLVALWQLRDADSGQSLVLRRSNFQRPVAGDSPLPTPDLDNVIAAMNRLTHELSAEIAKAVRKEVSS